MPTTFYASLFCFALASCLFLWCGGALGLTLRALFAPKATRKTLRDHLTRICRRWFERQLPKPKTPHDCPLCAAHHAPVPPRPAPLPYSTQKSKRGRTKHSDTQGHACLNPDCLYFGCTDTAIHALVADGWDGQQRDIRRFRCQACQHVFSNRRNTPRFRLQKPLLLVQTAFVLLALGMSRADIARVLGIDDETVARWLDRFGAHADHLHDALLRDLTPEILQLDEIRAELRSTPRIRWL